MSLVKKIKDILFEEEEITEPIKVVNEEPVKQAPPVREYREPVTPVIEPVVPKAPEVTSEHELFKTDNSFKFPDFDEEEFQQSMPKRQSPTNVLEYERKKVNERREQSRFERIEPKEAIEKRKFKPSPIISPVYGVLNQDYTPDDVKNRDDIDSLTLNLDEVRKRAFEPEEILIEPEEPKAELKEEPLVTFLDEESIDSNLKSIDDLLSSAADEEISLEDELEIPKDNSIEAITEELDNYELEPEIKEETNKLDETLENDLFELIDSMYETREEGE